MSQKTSCFVKLLWGCLSLILLVIGAIAFLTLTVVLTKPKPPRIETRSVQQSLYPAERMPLPLPGLPPEAKPLRLTMDIHMAELQILPDATREMITVEGDYDLANFDLTTDLETSDEEVSVTVNFDTKRTFWSMAFTGKLEEIRNRLIVHVPVSRPTALDLDFSMGEADVDLTGIPLTHLQLNHSMGDMRVSVREPNPLPMQWADLRLSMGEFRFNDFQNMRFENLRFDGRMGEAWFLSTGRFVTDGQAEFDMSMGELRVFVPANATLETDVSAGMTGHYEGPAGALDGRDDENPPRLKVRGNISFGEMVLSREIKKQPLGYLLLNTIQKDGVEAGIQQYRLLRENEFERYDFREYVLNNLGYQLLRRGDSKAAIEVFKLNVDVHPDYANGFDSLGEAYMIDGQGDLAIANYQRSLELDPNNGNALEMLSKLGVDVRD